MSLAVTGPSQANVDGVSGETVVFGDVTFIRDGNNLYIQASDGSIINYASFNIGADELVQFIQPGSNARVLNRILGVGPSEIDGQLLANGIVYIVNPAGVIFGADSVVNVGGIYASAANITNDDFLNQIDQFTGAVGDVVNHGTIQAQRVHLLGKQVRNFGNISAPDGVVTMLAGDSFLLGEVGGSILVYVDGSDVANEPAGTSNIDPDLDADAGVLNSGTIDVGSGHAFMAAGDMYALGIHNIGDIYAPDGQVTMATGDGAIYNQGTVDVSDDASAGSVLMRGPSIVNAGTIRADADNGQAGTIELLGHDHVYLLAESTTSAAGGSGNADGGTVLLIALDGLMLVSELAQLDASGGAQGGDGGFIETSGSQLILEGDIDLGAIDGYEAGLLYIDPWDLVIGANGADNGLVVDGTVEFTEGETIPGSQSFIAASFLSGLNGAILLEALNDIFVDEIIDLTLNGNSIAFNAGNDIFFNALIVGATGLDAIAGNAIHFQAPMNGDFDVSGAISLTALDIFSSGSLFGEGITIDGNLTLDGIGVNQIIDAGGGTLDITGDVTKTTSGQLELRGTPGISIGGDLTTNVGGVEVDDALTIVGDIDIAANGLFRQDVTLTGAGNQSITSGGAMRIDGELIKAGGNDVTVTGSTINLGGGADVGGDLTLVGPVNVGGNLDVGNDLEVIGLIAFTSGAVNQTASAGGLLRITGNVNRAMGNLRLEGGSGIQLLGDASVNVGSLVLDGATSIVGDVAVGSDLTFLDDVVFSAAALQTISAGDAIVANGTVSKPTGSLDMSGTTLTFNDAVAVATGSLSFDGAVIASADVDVANALDIDGSLTLDGAGVQTVTVGTLLTVSDFVFKPVGQLVLDAGLLLDIDGDLTVTTGALTLTSLAQLAGDVTAASLVFPQAVVFDGTGTQTVTAAGGIAFDASATRTGGNLVLNGPVDVATSLDADGDLTVNGALALLAAGAQTISAGDTLTIDGPVTKATGDLTLQGGTGVDLGGAVSVGAGDLTVDGLASFFGDVTASGTILLMDGASFTGLALQVVDGATIVIDGDVSKAAGDLRLAATAIDLNGDVAVSLGTLTLDGAATILGDVMAGGDVNLNDLVVLDGAAAQEILAGSVLTIAGGLTKNAGDLTLAGGSSIDVTSDVTVAGGLSASGGAWNQTATVSALSIDIGMDDTVSVSGDLLSGSTLTVRSGLDGTGDLLIGAVDLTGAMIVLEAGDGAGGGTTGQILVNPGATFANVGGAGQIVSFAFRQDASLAASDLPTAGQFTGGTAGIDLTLGSRDGDVVLDDASVIGDTQLTVESANDLTASIALALQSLDATVGGLATFSQGLTVTGATTLDGDASFSSNVDVGTLDVTGDLELAGIGDWTYTIGGDANVGGTLRFGGLGTRQFTAGGDVTLGAADLGNIGAGSIAAGGDLTVVGAIEGTGAGGRTLSAGGTLAAQGPIQLDAGDVVLVGALIDLADLVDVTGSLTLDGQAQVAGNIAAGTSLAFLADVVLDGTGAQVLAAGTLIMADGSVTKVQGDLTVDTPQFLVADDLTAGGSVTLSGDLSADEVSIDDDLVLTSDAGHALVASTLDVGGDLLATGLADVIVTTTGGTTVDGDVDIQTGGLDVSGTLDVGGDLDTGGALTTLDQTTVDGDVDAGGAIAFLGITTVGGDVTSGGSVDAMQQFTLAGALGATGDATFHDALVLSGAGAQSLTAGGTLTALGTITKAAGDLTLNASTLTSLFGAVAVDGDLDFTGPTALDLAGDALVAGGALRFADALTLASDVTIRSTGDREAVFAGTVAGPGGLWVDTAGDTRFEDAVDVGSITTLGGGRTLLSGDVTTVGVQQWGDAVVLLDDVAFTSTGDGTIEFDATLDGLFDVAVSTGGLVRFEDRVDIASLTTNGGTVRILTDRITTTGAQRYFSDVQLTRDTLLRSTGGGQLRLAQGAIGSAHDLTLETAGDTRLEGVVRVDRLTTDAAGTLSLGGNIRANGGFDFGESAATLVGDTVLRDATGGDAAFDLAIDGPHAIEFIGDGDLSLFGEIGASSPVAQFTARSPGTLFLHMDAIRATGDIRLNPAGRTDIPEVATIVAPDGSIRFLSSGGDFVMGIREKLTVFGALDIILSGASSQAILSDINSLDDMTVTASQILLQRRGMGFLLDGVDVRSVDPDRGLDFVTGGRFFFSVAPIAIGQGAVPAFASPDGLGDALGTLSGFVNQSFGSQISADDLISLDGAFLDLQSDGPTNANVSEAFASAIPRDEEIQDVPLETAIGANELERLRELSIDARRPDDAEYISNTQAGIALYSDVDSRFKSEPEVTVNRLLNDEVRAVLRLYEQLLTSTDGDQEVDRRRLVRSTLSEAEESFLDRFDETGVGYDDVTGEIDVAAFAAHLEATGKDDVIVFFRELDGLLGRIELLGLTDLELAVVRLRLLSRVLPSTTSLTTDDLLELVEIAGADAAS